MKYAVLLLVLTCGGCALGSGKIRGKDGITVTSVPDAGKPATLTSGESKTGFRIPKDSKIVIAEIEATAEQPARKETTVALSQDSEYTETASQTQASTGTIDIEVKKHQIDVESKKPLLYVAIFCVLAAIVCMAMKWPGPAICAGIAAGTFFAMWKLSDLPAWFIAIAVGAICKGVGMILGYKRGEWDNKTTEKA